MNALGPSLFLAPLGILALVVVLRMLRGDINLTGLFDIRSDDARAPERVQAVALAVALPLLYAIDALTALDVADPPSMLADVPEWMLAAAAGSQALYIGGKIARNTHGK